MHIQIGCSGVPPQEPPCRHGPPGQTDNKAMHMPEVPIKKQFNLRFWKIDKLL